jgi:hypothetical protein
MIFSVGAGPFSSPRSPSRPHCEPRTERSPCITSKFESSHPGRSDTNFDGQRVDSAASSCTSVQCLRRSNQPEDYDLGLKRGDFAWQNFQRMLVLEAELAAHRACALNCRACALRAPRARWPGARLPAPPGLGRLLRRLCSPPEWAPWMRRLSGATIAGIMASTGWPGASDGGPPQAQPRPLRCAGGNYG